mgnify:CR=1 FL=1
MKIIEKVIKVDKSIIGQVSVNGSSEIEHYVYETKMFIDTNKATDFATDEDVEDIVREDFECNACIDANGEISDVDVSELSIDELDVYELNRFLDEYPNYEVKEMKYEIDGVKSYDGRRWTKKVLVEKVATKVEGAAK